MGINYEEIESNSVGNKIDYIMHSLDFEEYLWAKGYSNEQIEDLYQCMTKNEPLSKIQYDVMMENFQEYMIVGGMPLIVKTFVENKTYTGILEMQKQIILNYEEDITKYAGGLDKTKILNAYRKFHVFLGNENKKFQITKISSGVRNGEYVGVIEWLENAGIVNICYWIDNDKYKDIKYGIKLCNKNIGFNGKFYTFPYFLTFLLKRYLNEKNI